MMIVKMRSKEGKYLVDLFEHPRRARNISLKEISLKQSLLSSKQWRFPTPITTKSGGVNSSFILDASIIGDYDVNRIVLFS